MVSTCSKTPLSGMWAALISTLSLIGSGCYPHDDHTGHQPPGGAAEVSVAGEKLTSAFSRSVLYFSSVKKIRISVGLTVWYATWWPCVFMTSMCEASAASANQVFHVNKKGNKETFIDFFLSCFLASWSECIIHVKGKLTSESNTAAVLHATHSTLHTELSFFTFHVHKESHPCPYLLNVLLWKPNCLWPQTANTPLCMKTQ